ncbi:MAG: DUF5615 family PIN-like protein [Thermodesulfobacteriota bacterium]
MNLVADEGVDRAIIERLRADGHDVLYVSEMAPGIADETVLDLARERRAILVTSDKDFGELVFRQGRLSAGVVLLRLQGLKAAEKAALTAEALAACGPNVGGGFAVVTPRALRVRPGRGAR